MKQVTIYTDGACSGNPGPGGWAAILIYGETRKEIADACPATTNNRMELTAAIEALRLLKDRCRVDLYTDSKYLCDAMTIWMAKWKACGWKRGKKPVKNLDLWKILDDLAQEHEIHWQWIRGHSMHPENERCDQLAVRAIEDLRSELGHYALTKALDEFQSE